MAQQTTPVDLKDAEVQELASRMRGTLLRPSDAGYEQTRRVYNGMIDKRPALIAHCTEVADVIAARTGQSCPASERHPAVVGRWSRSEWVCDEHHRTGPA